MNTLKMFGTTAKVSECQMLTMKNLQTKKQYDLVSDDGYDSRIPLHNEAAFQHGLQFQAKYIGTLDVPRPSSRVEIVAAMRRIRYEFKAKAIKKKKVNIFISTDGVRIMLAKRKKKKQTLLSEDGSCLVMQHPIFRIFYVSHDSQDLKIFSYIARDGSTNIFKCNVFKAYKKNHAMRVVRTIGQAFEVCHKKSLHKEQENEEGNEAGSEKSADDVEPTVRKSPSKASVQTAPLTTSTPKPPSTPQSPDEVLKQAQTLLQTVSPKPSQVAGTISSPSSPPLDNGLYLMPTPQPLSTQHHLQLLQQQLELQTQQTQVAVAQSNMLKDQLAAETTARTEAQARTHQLLVQNRELLEHINTLVGRLQYLEVRVTKSSISDGGLYRTSQVGVMPAANRLSALPSTEGSTGRSGDHLHNMVEFTESPDSGHREMSSDSLACSAGQPDAFPWYANTSSINSHANIQRSVSSNGYSQGAMPANNRPELNLPLRSSSNPFAPSVSTSLYANVGVREPEVITPLPLQDASGNRLELNVAPRLDPPPKVNRRSPNIVATSSSVGMMTSPNGNRSVSSTSTMSDNSFEVHLNQLLEQATMNHNNMTENIVNERKELNTLPGLDKNLNNTSGGQLTYSNRSFDQMHDNSAMILTASRLRKLSFSDEENTEEVDETDVKNVLKGDELEMFSDLDAFSS